MLSGGERALTSIAILFAIIAHNPPPFSVLDEIDAALDEANSFRLSRIIKEIADKPQFVIITHNREMMNQADVLYGVTMQDDGVSKIVSVKLDEFGE
jgi:chromosome segregation protein